MSNIIKALEEEQLKSDLPKFAPGDTVVVKVKVKEGEMFVVPAGVEHRPSSENESQIMLIEPKGVVNTGEHQSSDLTAKNDVWV